MDSEIIGLAQWFATDPGRYLLRWEQEQFDDALSDVFGYHALQLGMPQLHGLRCNRMPHQWLASGGDLAGGEPSAQAMPGRSPVALCPSLTLHSAGLPFSASSLDLVVLPHTLELSDDPHLALREVERVLVPEGRVVISGLNPASLWGLRQRRSRWLQGMGRGQLFLPEKGEFIGYWRLRDWLRLLGFEVESARFGGYRPALTTQRWLERFAWMDRLGAQWWPIFGAVYFVVAIKRVRGTRLIEPVRRPAGRRSAAPATAAQQQVRGGSTGASLAKRSIVPDRADRI